MLKLPAMFPACASQLTNQWLVLSRTVLVASAHPNGTDKERSISVWPKGLVFALLLCMVPRGWMQWITFVRNAQTMSCCAVPLG
jgi:hypothetical protein